MAKFFVRAKAVSPGEFEITDLKFQKGDVQETGSSPGLTHLWYFGLNRPYLTFGKTENE